MKTKSTLVLLFLVCTFTVFSQVTEAEKNLKTLDTDTVSGWKFGAVTGVNLAQTALVNWAAGGESTFAVNGLMSVFANYKSENAAWDNSLDVGYGLLKQGKNQGFIKTDDRFDLLSKYGQKAFSDFYYTALVNFKTQFAPGYNYPNDSVMISNFLAPAYLLGAVGLNYKPNEYFNGKIQVVNATLLFFKFLF